jgi:nucleolar protein 53
MSEVDSSGIVREKEDGELYSIDEVGGVTAADIDDTTVVEEPPKKKRRALRVDEVLGTTETKSSIPSHVPKSKRPSRLTTAEKEKPVEEEGKETYDVWNKIEIIPAPENLPPPAILAYSKSVPALPPSTLRSSSRLLRPRETVDAVTIAEGGQSYNPALEDWEDLISRTAEREEERLTKIAMKEWVPQPEDVETPAADQDDSDEHDEDNNDQGENRGLTFLGKPVKVQRKTQAQRNKQARQQEQLRLRHLAQTLKSKHKQISNLPSLLTQVTLPRGDSSLKKPKKTKELPVAPLEVQLSDELAESLRLLKPEGNLFRDRYRSLVERGIVEGRFQRNRRGRRYPVKYVEKYDYKHWGKYYGKQ